MTAPSPILVRSDGPFSAGLHPARSSSARWSTARLRAFGSLGVRWAARAFRLPDRHDLLYWSTWHDRLHLLQELRKATAARGWPTRVGDGCAAWDIEFRTSPFATIRLSTLSEIHETANLCGRLTRARLDARLTPLGRWLIATTAPVPPAAAVVWLVLCRHALRPIRRLMNEVTDSAGYWPVRPRGG